MSDFDLYRENGNVVFPYRPTVRYATPVFNDDGLPARLRVLEAMRTVGLDLLEYVHAA